MELQGRIALVTGAGRGIGRAVCRELHRRGAGGIAVLDLDPGLARETADEFEGLALSCDVSSAQALRDSIAAAERHFGRLDLLVSNAGFGSTELDLDDALSAPDATWQRMWDVHVMAHVHACRAALPGMLARGEGCLVNVASAAGLLSQVGDTAYSATKHAAVSLAESLSITYGDRGIQVSVVCPQYVATAIIGLEESADTGALPGIITVEQAATAIADGIEAGRFLILTHPEVLDYFRGKTADYERWLGGMRKLRERIRAGDMFKLKR